MNAAEARELFGYNQWAHDKVWRCVLVLDAERFTRALPYSVGSICQQLGHVMNVDRSWCARLGGEPDHEWIALEAFPTPAALHGEWQAHAARNRAVVESIDDAGWAEVIHYDMGSYGGPRASTRGQILRHVVNHGTDHRAQILAGLAQLGAATVEHDLMFYLWQLAEGAPGAGAGRSAPA